MMTSLCSTRSRSSWARIVWGAVCVKTSIWVDI